MNKVEFGNSGQIFQLGIKMMEAIFQKFLLCELEEKESGAQAANPRFIKYVFIGTPTYGVQDTAYRVVEDQTLISLCSEGVYNLVGQS